MLKIQDLIFFLTFLLVGLKAKSKLATLAGLGCLALAIPLFYFKVLFTAERLTWYAAAFLFYAVVLWGKRQ